MGHRGERPFSCVPELVAGPRPMRWSIGFDLYGSFRLLDCHREPSMLVRQFYCGHPLIVDSRIW